MVGADPINRPHIDPPYQRGFIFDTNLAMPFNGTIVGFNFFVDTNRANDSVIEFQVYRPLSKSILYNTEMGKYEAYDKNELMWYTLIHSTRKIFASSFAHTTPGDNTSYSLVLIPPTYSQMTVQAGDIPVIRFFSSNAITYSLEPADRYCPKLMFSYSTNVIDFNYNNNSIENSILYPNKNYNININKTDNRCKKYAFQTILEINDSTITQEMSKTCK